MTKEHAKAAGRVVQAYSRYCRDHSVPQPSRMDIAIMSQQCRNLLKGGYAESDVLGEALTIATQYTLYTGHKGMTQLQRRVQQSAADNQEREHIVFRAEESESPVDPRVLEAMRGAVKRMRSFDAPLDAPYVWTRKCSATGCVRTASLNKEHCLDHQP